MQKCTAALALQNLVLWDNLLTAKRLLIRGDAQHNTALDLPCSHIIKNLIDVIEVLLLNSALH